MKSENLKISSGYILICVLWGSTWLAIRLGLDSLTPLIAAGLRFISASIFILIFIYFTKTKIQLDKLSVRLYLMMGFFSFVIPFGLVYWAEQYIPSGLTSVLFAVFPFFVIIFSKIMMPETGVQPAQTLGAVLGFIGIFIIFSDDLSVDLGLNFWGMLAVFISAAMQGYIAVAIKKYGHHLNPLSMNFFPLLIAGLTMTVLSILFEDRSGWTFDSKAVLSIIYLAFFGTVLTFTTYYWLMKRINVVILSLSSFITPIIAVFLGYIILAERLSAQDFAGSFLVLFGILLANLKGLINYIKYKRNGIEV